MKKKGSEMFKRQLSPSQRYEAEASLYFKRARMDALLDRGTAILRIPTYTPDSLLKGLDALKEAIRVEENPHRAHQLEKRFRQFRKRLRY